MTEKLDSIKVIALDCDGVMFDSSDANRSYYNAILKHFSMPPLTDEAFAYAHMQTVDKALSHLFQSEAMLDEAHIFRKKLTYFPFISLLKKDPHLNELIERLSPFYRLAIATNRTDTMFHVIKEYGLEGSFQYVVTAMDVNNPKPDPEPIVKILDHFKILPQEMIYVGDSSVDEEASKKAGVVFAACNNENLSADFHIRGLKDLITLFDGLISH